MEVVSCYCKKCESEAGRFRNSWIGIGNTYFTPSYPPLSVDGIQATGDVYDAARDSQIQDSVLQDLACERCNKILGLRCDKAPEGHLLRKDQLILRLSEMSVLSEFSGKKAKISILKTYPLTFAPGLRRTSAAIVPSPIPSPQLLGTPSVIPAVLDSRHLSPAQPGRDEPSPIHPAKFKSWAENAISSQQHDIDRLSGTAERLEREMRLFREFMEETRAALCSSQVPPIENSNELSSLQSELKEIRQKVDQNGSLMTRATLDIARNVNVVVEDIQRVSEKTNQVDLLKAQVADMQSQIRSLEAKHNSLAVPAAASGHRLSSLEKRKRADDHQEYTIEEVRMYGGLTKRRKVSGIESPPNLSPRHDGVSFNDGPKRVHTPAREVAGVPLSSHSYPSTSLPAPQSEPMTSNTVPGSLSDSPNSSNPEAMFHGQRENGMTSSTARVVINNSLRPSLMMPLQSGTLFDVNDRNDFLEVSPIEAATGQKRDVNGKWLPKYERNPVLPATRRKRNKSGLNAVFANGLVDNLNVDDHEQDRRRSLRPRTTQNNAMPPAFAEIHSYDGHQDDELHTPESNADGEKDEDPDHVGYPTVAAFFRATREYTVPPVEWPEDLDAKKLPLPSFYKCGTCNKFYRTLQALDYHQEHSKCIKGVNDVVPEAFKCGICQKLFVSFTGIKEHMLKKLCKSGKSPDRGATSNLLKCKHCNKEYKNGHSCLLQRLSVVPTSTSATKPRQSTEPAAQLLGSGHASKVDKPQEMSGMMAEGSGAVQAANTAKAAHLLEMDNSAELIQDSAIENSEQAMSVD